MPTAAGARKTNRRHESEGQLTWDWFDRELAEIKATLARLESDSEPKPVASAPAAKRPQGLARATEEPRNATAPTANGAVASVATAVAQASPAAGSAKPQPTAAAAAPAPWPTGSDLSDPKNFGLMPPTANLEQGSASAEDHRKRLARDLAFANKVLHTSRVPAAVWREWRVFEKAAQERLRALTVQPVPLD